MIQGGRKFLRKAIALGLVILAWGVAVCVIVEGVSSSLLFAREILRLRGKGDLAERRHTRHDRLLGWVNQPHTYLPDGYGPGVYVRINGQGFRANSDVAARVPDGRIRMICSGDSYTFGYGVDNDHAWCRLLQDGDRRLETVNMGQGGYGVDQAYLWYERDAARIDHQVHLFAFITIDFQRMQSAAFMGYPKPTLAVENGALVVRHVPVPQRPAYASWVTRFEPAFRDLKMTRLMDRVMYRLGFGSSASREGADAAAWAVASVLFEQLRDLNRSRGSTLVLVYLPTQKDFANTTVDPWRKRVKDLGTRAGIAVVDLVDDFRRLPASDIPAMFIQTSDLDYAGAAGHLTVAGNRWVARVLYDRLVAVPGVLPLSGP